MINGRHILSAVLLGMLCLWAFTGPLRAAEEEAPLSVRSEVNRAFMTVGDLLEYTVLVRHRTNVQILSRISPPSGDILKIKEVRDIQTEEDGWILEGRRFVLTTFRLGEFILDPVEVQYRVGEGDVQTIKTDPIYIKVRSVAEGEEKTDIRDIKSVLELARKQLWAIILLALALAILAGWILYRNLKRASAVSQPLEPAMSPAEEALFRLNQLFDSGLIKKGKIKEYYLQLSEILRIYFEKRYGILAIEATTYEIMGALKNAEVPLVLREKIENVLASADLAKFAKWIPEPKEIIQINQQSKRIVEESRFDVQTVESVS